MADKYNPKEARHLFTLPAIRDLLNDWNFKWDKCTGEQSGKNYRVTYRHKGVLVRTIIFSQSTYREQIRVGRNDWINNKILNRSELAGRIWPEMNSPNNKIRRRLEEKAYWGTFTSDEKKKIVAEVRKMVVEIEKAFKD